MCNVHLNVGASDVTCDIARDCKQATNKQKDKRGVTNDHDQCQNVPSQVIRRGRGVGNISIQYFDFFKALALALFQNIELKFCQTNKNPPTLFSFTLQLQWGNRPKMRYGHNF